VRRQFPDHPPDVRRQILLTRLRDIDLFKRMDEFKLLMIEQPLAWNDIIDHISFRRRFRLPSVWMSRFSMPKTPAKPIDSGACKDHQHQAGPSCRTHRSEESARCLCGPFHSGVVRRHVGGGHWPGS
jgi:hypothetical protein